MDIPHIISPGCHQPQARHHPLQRLHVIHQFSDGGWRQGDVVIGDQDLIVALKHLAHCEVIIVTKIALSAVEDPDFNIVWSIFIHRLHQLGEVRAAHRAYDKRDHARSKTIKPLLFS